MLTINLKERQKPVFLFHAEICFDYDIKGSVTPLVCTVQVFKHAQVNNEAHEGTIIFIKHILVRLQYVLSYTATDLF